jgi:hypothetical protein
MPLADNHDMVKTFLEPPFCAPLASQIGLAGTSLRTKQKARLSTKPERALSSSLRPWIIYRPFCCCKGQGPKRHSPSAVTVRLSSAF